MASDRTLTPLVENGSFFECPRWHEGRWWISDFYAHTVSTIGEDGSLETVVEVEGQPSGIGWMPDGDLLVVSMKDRRVLRRGGDGTVTTHADLSEIATGHLNDMLVRDGHAYVGNFGFDLMAGDDPTTAALVHLDPDGTPTVEADDLWFPNGMVIGPGGELIIAETIGGRFSAFDFAADGSLDNQRVWAQVEPTAEPAGLDTMLAAYTFAPDGCAIDAEGHVWAANALGGKLCRVAAGGEIVDEIPMPDGLGVYACGLGGPDGTQLVACAAPDFFEHARKDTREAILFTTTVDVPAA